MRLYPHQILLLNLEGKQSKLPLQVQMLPQEALRQLNAASGQDFGYDAKAWRKFIRANGGAFRALPGLYPYHPGAKKAVNSPTITTYPLINDILDMILT